MSFQKYGYRLQIFNFVLYFPNYLVLKIQLNYEILISLFMFLYFGYLINLQIIFLPNLLRHRFQLYKIKN